MMRPTIMQWLLLVGTLLTLTGYWGPWVGHPVAGLVITGLDLGEYVKFLPPVRDGQITVWRPGFYAPLVTVSAAALLAAYRRAFAFRWWQRGLLLLITIAAALNLVPPAWTPARLLEPEFRVQTASLVALLLGVALAPFLALLPRTLVSLLVIGLGVIGLVAPTYGFFQVLPEIETLYRQPLAPAWGLWLYLAGLILIILVYLRLPFLPRS